jgi:hypothetical protein
VTVPPAWNGAASQQTPETVTAGKTRLRGWQAAELGVLVRVVPAAAQVTCSFQTGGGPAWQERTKPMPLPVAGQLAEPAQEVPL